MLSLLQTQTTPSSVVGLMRPVHVQDIVMIGTSHGWDSWGCPKCPEGMLSCEGCWGQGRKSCPWAFWFPFAAEQRPSPTPPSLRGTDIRAGWLREKQTNLRQELDAERDQSVVPARITELHVPMCHHRKQGTTQPVPKQLGPVCRLMKQEKGWQAELGISNCRPGMLVRASKAGGCRDRLEGAG